METKQNDNKVKRWFKRFGVATFIILLVKGIVWVVIAYLLIK